MKVSDEVVSVVLRQSHEGPAHHDELHFVDAVAQLLQLQITPEGWVPLKQWTYLHLQLSAAMHHYSAERSFCSLKKLTVIKLQTASAHKPDPPQAKLHGKKQKLCPV